jgi:hypothetical protein
LAFKKRNPDLVLRTHEATSLMRATGFNKPQVDQFYDLLLQVQEQFGFQASHIYIMPMKQESQLSIKMIRYCQ